MIEWMLMPLKRYAEFSGRSRRKEYWSFFLLNLLISAVLIAPILFVMKSNAATDVSTGPGGFEAAARSQFQFGDYPIATAFLALGAIWGLVTVIPNLAVTVRRLHDRDMSGWWYVGFMVAGVIPFIGFIAGLAFLVLMLLEGTRGPNRFGPDPKGEHSADVFS